MIHLNRESDGKEIFRLAKEGHKIAVEEIDEFVFYLVEGIPNLCYVVNPKMLVLGGGIMEQIEYFQPGIEKLFKRKADFKGVQKHKNRICVAQESCRNHWDILSLQTINDVIPYPFIHFERICLVQILLNI